jgi:hypothetical protein
MSGWAKIGAVVRKVFSFRKACSQAGLQTNLASFYKSLVIGWAILEKFGIKRL